jgi:hypothetical protein
MRRSNGIAGGVIAIVGSILVLLPLLVVVLGVLLITPARVERSPVPTSQAVVVAVEPAEAPELAPTTPDETLTRRPPEGTPPSGPEPGGSARHVFPSIVPDTWLEALVTPAIIAGLVVLLGAAIVALALRRWSGDGEDDGLSQSRVVLLALAFWIALTLFLILDLGLGLAVSVYVTFVVAYAAFWVLVGALLLCHRPKREKALILVLFVVVVLSVRFIDWNSRKPFVRDFDRVTDGMTKVQVDGIMGRYIREADLPPIPLGEGGESMEAVVYRHTDTGLGAVDRGIVAFEGGRAVHRELLGVGLSRRPAPPGADAAAGTVGGGGYVLLRWEEGLAVMIWYDISAPEVHVGGLNGIKGELDRLPGGEQVFWSAGRVPNTDLPPREIVEEVIAYCRKRGIRLDVEQTDPIPQLAVTPHPTLTPTTPTTTPILGDTAVGGVMMAIRQPTLIALGSRRARE